MTDPDSLPQKLQRMQHLSLAAGLAGLGVLLAAWFSGSPDFYPSYLVGWLFALGFALGGLLILCIHHLATGGWGFLLRRIAEAAAMTILPIMVLLLPILFSLDQLYPWALKAADGSLAYAHDPVISAKTAYLNVPGIWLRYLVYTLVWAGGAFLFWTWSRRQDLTGEIVYRKKMRALAGPLALAYALTVTFASVDYVMALEPKWFSSIFGVMLAAGHILSLLTFGILFLSFLARWEPIKSEFTAKRQHDLGKLLFAFVIFWAYIEVSQFIIYWHANLPEEITWYMNRYGSTYGAVSQILVLSQFVIPFLYLLSQANKKNRRALVGIAIFLLALRALDMFWMVLPSITQPATGTDLYPYPTTAMGCAPFHVLNLVGPVAFGLLWFGLFLRNLRSRPLLPTNDPYFSRHPEIVKEGV